MPGKTGTRITGRSSALDDWKIQSEKRRRETGGVLVLEVAKKQTLSS
jgi:hypothetical protein